MTEYSRQGNEAHEMWRPDDLHEATESVSPMLVTAAIMNLHGEILGEQRT